LEEEGDDEDWLENPVMGAEGMAAMTMLTRSLKRRLQRLEDLLPPASEEPNVLVIQFVDSKRQVVGEERITLSAPPRPPKPQPIHPAENGVVVAYR
jgi:hypothetical protein